MVDSVVWAQYINVTDTHTDRHVAIATTVPQHCVGRYHFISQDTFITNAGE